MEKQVELKRSMGLMSGLSMVVGTVIGSGVFFKQAGVLQQAGSTTMGLVAWIAGGIITLAAGLTIAEVANRLPKTGGLYSYIEELFGPTAGFLTGWMQVVVYAPAVIASIGGYAAYLTANFLGWDNINSALDYGCLHCVYHGFEYVRKSCNRSFPINYNFNQDDSDCGVDCLWFVFRRS